MANSRAALQGKETIRMNDQRLFELLRQQPPSTLLELLQQAYRQLTVAQRETVFYAIGILFEMETRETQTILRQAQGERLRDCNRYVFSVHAEPVEA